jgi:hypothetical protein
MTIKFTITDSATGAILRTGTTMTMATALLQAGPGETLTTVGSDPIRDTVDPGTSTATPKPLMTRDGTATNVNRTSMLANGSDFITISNIPNGAGYHFVVPVGKGLQDITPATVADGVLEITTTVPGSYTVILTYPNMLNFRVNFNAN